MSHIPVYEWMWRLDDDTEADTFLMLMYQTLRVLDNHNLCIFGVNSASYGSRPSADIRRLLINTRVRNAMLVNATCISERYDNHPSTLWNIHPHGQVKRDYFLTHLYPVRCAFVSKSLKPLHYIQLEIEIRWTTWARNPDDLRATHLNIDTFNSALYQIGACVAPYVKRKICHAVIDECGGLIPYPAERKSAWERR